MSEFSEQITYVLDGTVVPKMKDYVSTIALIEPYSIDSEELKRNYNELNYLTSIYDYLHEYEEGNEEIDVVTLFQIVRLLGNININLQPEVFDPPTNQQPQTAFFDVYIDGVKFANGGDVLIGSHDIEVRYNGECDVTKLIYKQKMVGAPGKTVYMQNADFDVPGEIEFRAYGNNNILLTSAKIYFQIGT